MTDRSVSIEIVRSGEGFDGEKAVIPERTHDVAFVADTQTDSETIEVAFDSQAGILSVITSYGIFQAGGFLTQDSLGTGTPGKKGDTGRQGKKGRDGFEGREGKVGCAGIPGKTGFKGTDGLDAEDGPRGAPGAIGCGGDEGPTGIMGPMGPTGPDGSRGAIGSSCLIGPTGDTGPTPSGDVFISDNEPTDPLIFIWGQPVDVDTGIPENPEIVEDMKGNVADKTITLTHAGADFFEGIAAFSLTNFEGGKGPFTYAWTGDYETMPEITVHETGSSSTNVNLRCRVFIAQNTTFGKSGTIRITVTDTGDANKTLVVPAIFSFRGSNAAVTPPTDPNPPGGGGGCIVYGSKVNIPGSATRLVQQVYEGDSISGLDIAGLPDSTYDSAAFIPWNTRNLVASNTDVTVRSAKHSTHTNYYLINNVLRLTNEEHLLVCRNGYWSFMRILDIRIGDKLRHISGVDHPVTSIENIVGQVSVVSLDVESVDTFYVEGYLLHNRDIGAPVVKK